MENVLANWADTNLLRDLLGHTPHTNFDYGLAEFVSWFKNYKYRK